MSRHSTDWLSATSSLLSLRGARGCRVPAARHNHPAPAPASNRPRPPAERPEKLAHRQNRWMSPELSHKKKPSLREGFLKKDGVIDGARTRDNWNHKPGLYQLSYNHHFLCATKRKRVPKGYGKRGFLTRKNEGRRGNYFFSPPEPSVGGASLSVFLSTAAPMEASFSSICSYPRSMW